MVLTAINTLRAVVICALASGAYTFYLSSTALRDQLAREGLDVGRIEAFMDASKTVGGFWTHIYGAWGVSFGISLASCLVLMAWISIRTSDESPPRAPEDRTAER